MTDSSAQDADIAVEVDALRYLVQRGRARELGEFAWIEIEALAALVRTQAVRHEGVDGVPYSLSEVAESIVDEESRPRSAYGKLFDRLKKAQVFDVLAPIAREIAPDRGEAAVQHLVATDRARKQRLAAAAVVESSREFAEAITTGRTDAAADARDRIARLLVTTTRDTSLPTALETALTGMCESVQPCSASQGVRLDTRRGHLGQWISAHLGSRGALLPSKNLLLGAAPGGGKTSIAGAIAVDALGSDHPCAVHWVQLELNQSETLMHMMSQVLTEADGGMTARKSTAERAAKIPGLIHTWSQGLLSFDHTEGSLRSDYRHVIEEIRGFAARVRNLRKAGLHRHDVQGVVILDYCQLLTDATLRSAQGSSDLLPMACSRVQLAAAEEGVAIVMLSQCTKLSQREATAGDGSAFRGIDTNFADTALVIHRAAFEKEGSRWLPTTDRVEVAENEEKGEARLLTLIKSRGACGQLVASGKLSNQAIGWTRHRHYHGMVDDFAAKDPLRASQASTSRY